MGASGTELEEGDPAQELATLAWALRRLGTRAASLGRQRVPLSPAPAELAQPPSEARTEPSPEPSPEAVAPPPPPPGTEPTTEPTTGQTPTLRVDVEALADQVRTRAAACEDLDSLRTAVAACEACALCRSRTQTVFMDGKSGARVLFVGEAPGQREDEQGIPFVGPAGGLLTDIVEKGMGLARREVAIANVLKCRPPGNRDPLPAEKRICTGWLERQIELLDPAVIVALGRHAAGHMLDSDAPMGRMRGRVRLRAGRKVVATYHPAFLLRSPQFKRPCWEDIQLAMAELDRPQGKSGDAPAESPSNPGDSGPR